MSLALVLENSSRPVTKITAVALDRIEKTFYTVEQISFNAGGRVAALRANHLSFAYKGGRRHVQRVFHGNALQMVLHGTLSNVGMPASGQGVNSDNFSLHTCTCVKHLENCKIFAKNEVSKVILCKYFT